MADSIDRTIYRLEIDGSDYIRGLDSLSASTQKFSQLQQASNETLKANEAALKRISDSIVKAKKDLEGYTGTDENYRKQIEKTIGSLEKEHITLSGVVDTNKKNYDSLTKSVNEFSEAQKKAAANPLPAVPPTPVSVAGGLRNQILGSIDLAGITDLAEITLKTNQEFTELAEAITLADKALEGLAPDSAEFKQLAPIVEQGKIALKQFEDAAKGAEENTGSLRGQLRLAREELVKLEAAGKAGTKEYIDLELKTAKLTDAFSDQQQRIKILASDTRALDFGKAAITAATSAFSAYTSVSILAGDQSEELQKKTLQLFAAMQLLTSVEQLANTVRREGILGLNLQSAAQSAYTAVVGTSTGALKVFRLALAATGIGAAIIAIGYLVVKYNQLRDAQREAERETRLLAEVNKEAAKSAGDEIANLEILYKVATNTTLSLKARKEAVDGLQKQYPDYFKNIKDEIILQGGAKDAYDATKLAILESAKARAIESKLGTLASDELEKQQEREELLAKQRKNARDKEKADKKDNRDAETRGLDQFNVLAAGAEITKQLADNNKDLEGIAKDREFLLNQITTPPKKTPTKDPTGDKKGIENIFIQERDKLLSQLADLRNKEVESIKTINDDFAAKLIVEQNRIAGLVKDKKVTKAQGNVLFDIAKDINKAALDKALADFNKKVIDARKKLNDELIDLQNKNTEDTLNLIRDDFAKRAALIEFNEQQELADSKQATLNRIADLEANKSLLFEASFSGEQEFQNAKNKIIEEGQKEENNIIAKSNAERQDLSADVFAQSLETLENVLDENLLQLDETVAGKIQEQKALLNSGAINYDEFQKRITKILADQKKERDKIRLEELNTELAQINKRLETVTNAEEKESLQKRQRSVRGEIANIQSETPKDPNEKKVVETVQQYATAIGQLTDEIIGFWAKANEAEAKALDNSIALQEKRVEAAQRIAERGNASYLKAEQDRLNELQVKRENAARRQLAIDAALQASQLLVGITGAISKIATPGIGIAEVIGSIAVIAGALASGFAIVKSLQGNQPRLKKGTKYLTRDGNPSGVDTIPVMANEGEAVIPTEINKKYHPTIAAIYDQKIPADQLNNFVNNYHKIKSVPQPNYQRIKEAAEIKLTQDGRMVLAINDQNKLIQENNDLQRQTLRAMKNMSVSANIDRDGVAIMVNEYINQMNIDRKT